MNINVRAYTEKDLSDMIRIWNEVVEDGVAFPQEEFLTEETGKSFSLEECFPMMRKRLLMRWWILSGVQ